MKQTGRQKSSIYIAARYVKSQN